MACPQSEIQPSEAVAVRLEGGLGNQLFQYAAGRALSLRLGCTLVLDTSLLEQHTAQRTDRPYALGAFRIAGSAGSACPDGWSEYQQPGYCYDPGFATLGRGTRLHGYFQSETFFASCRAVLRQDLQLARPPSALFMELSQGIRGTRLPVSVHLRRGDMAADPRTRSFHGICGPEHYAKAMRILEGLTGSTPSYVVFSDDMAEARALFGKLPSVIFAATPAESPWEDLLLMAQCRHHILANSSFSWWGSWLNPSDDKIILAPRRWVSPEALRVLNTADLYLDGTIII